MAGFRPLCNKILILLSSNCFFLDCTAPFQVGIVTDAMTDPKDAATAPDATTANKQQSRGN